MKSRAYLKCEAIMYAAVERGFTKNVSRFVLEDIIIEKIGGDGRTLAKYIGLLQRLGFVSCEGERLYCLNLRLVGGCLEGAVEVGQKKLV